MKKIHYILLSILSGLLLSLGWPARGFPFLLLISFVPLLLIEQSTASNPNSTKKKNYVFLYFYLAFFTWNLVTTWWIANATLFGAIFAIIFNSLFMTIVFQLFHLTKKINGKIIGYISLPVYWIAFEYLHMNWELSWSWLNLGNGFANYPQFIQWYEYTGVLGGTFWILTINILLFNVIDYKLIVSNIKFNWYKLSFLLLCLFLPILISLIMYENYKEDGKKIDIVIVQPNIDPYNEKFGGMSMKDQLDKMLGLATKKVNLNTDILIFPETAISDGICENNPEQEPGIIILRAFLKRFPNLKIVIGMSTYHIYSKDEPKSPTARQFTNDSQTSNNWYDLYNSAILIDSSRIIQIYHKSKLVPGVERMPYPGIFKFLDKYSINMGGMTGSLGTQNERTPFRIRNNILNNNNLKFKTQNPELCIAPAICYESIYGEFMTKYVKNGATIISIITNDGWWKDTPGYKQHFQYARLRAIETRRSIARSANTGTSGFINQRGDILQSTKWWVPDSIENKLCLNNKLTFYVKYGDYLGKFFLIIVVLLIILTIFKIFK